MQCVRAGVCPTLQKVLSGVLSVHPTPEVQVNLFICRKQNQGNSR